MAEKKSLEERYADEVLTDNSALNHYSQCKNCAFRDKRLIGDEEYGYDKSVCRIYGSRTASTLKASDGKPFSHIHLLKRMISRKVFMITLKNVNTTKRNRHF